MEEKRCYKCKGRLSPHDSHELQTRFTNGIQQSLCGVCADIVNDAMINSRSYYGINGRAWQIALRRFKRKNAIPMYGRTNALQNEMIEEKRKALLRLMFWMDIRAVKKVIP